MPLPDIYPAADGNAAEAGVASTPGNWVARARSEPVYAPRRPRNALYRRCDLCLRVFKWFPVVFITSVLAWGYYAYVIQLCILTMESVILQVICALLFHVFYIMTFWSYWQTIFTDIGRVPRQFWFTTTDMEKMGKEATEEGRRKVFADIVRDRNLPVFCRTYNGDFRLCEKCNLIKPDRAHHCSVCDACVLKMDHHCPWVNNCVNFTNYKFFVLFLGYSFSLCLFSAVTTFPYFLRFWKNDLHNMGKFHILFLFFVSIMFAISLISLFGYHVYLVLKNRSTLESFRAPVFRFGPDKKAYDLGNTRNWKEIFGPSKAKWFLPIHTALGDGLIYPTNDSHQEQEHRLEGVSLTSSPGSGPDHRPPSADHPIKMSPGQGQPNFYNSIDSRSPGTPGSGALLYPNGEAVNCSQAMSPSSRGTGLVFENRCEDNDEEEGRNPLLGQASDFEAGHGEEVAFRRGVGGDIHSNGKATALRNNFVRTSPTLLSPVRDPEEHRMD